MDVICLETEAFYSLVDKVYERLKESSEHRDKWVDGDEAMRLLGVKSKTTMQTLRDERKIRFTQPQPRIIAYDRDSIDEYLDKHSQDPL